MSMDVDEPRAPDHPQAGRIRTPATYLLVVVLPLLAVVVLVGTAGRWTGPSATGADGTHGADGLLGRLLLAVAVIVALAAAGGALARRLGQPAVLGELTVGLLLGPSALGAVLPAAQQWLFPAFILPHLDALAQLGVILFMFLVGGELDVRLLRRAGGRGLVIGHAAVVVPLLAGVVFALTLAGSYRPDDVARTSFTLFVGVCFAISAFPVLARILVEQGLIRTPLGATGLTAAGVGDVTAWCLLLVVVTGLRGTSPAAAIRSAVLVALFTAVMLLFVRPLLARLLAWAERGGRPGAGLFTALIALVLVCALATELIGVHAIFGAFLAGVVMPRGSATVRELYPRVEGVAMWLMLPVFFVVIGQQIDLTALRLGNQWWLCLAILVIAVASKVAGAAVATVASGGSRRDGLAFGVMLNCRGLTELIVLSMGLQLGVLNHELFAMFIVMALLTTAMTGPLLRRVVPAGVTASQSTSALTRSP